MMNFITQNTALPPYLMLPRFLLEYDLSGTPLLIYVLLLDRIRISKSNPKWADEQGRVFVYYPLDQLAKDACRSIRVVSKALAELEKADLIRRRHQGPGRPSRIFLKAPVHSSACTNVPSSMEENSIRGWKKTSTHAGSFSPTNNNKREITREKEEERNTLVTGYGSYSNVFLTGEEYDRLSDAFPGLDVIIDKMSCYLASTGKTYTNYEAALRSWIQREPKSYLTMDYSFEEGESL